MVIDSSIILSIYFNEDKASWAAKQLELYENDLKICVVNLTEIVIRIIDKQPNLYDKFYKTFIESPIEFIPVDKEQALVAAEARLKFPINLGDSFAYALAKTLNEPLLTLDSDFKKTDLNILTC